MKRIKFTTILIFLCLLASCSTPRPSGKTEAEVLFKEAKVMMDKGRYLNATERLNELRKKFPFSYYTTPSELLLADILFQQDNFVESAAAYILFKDFHPKHKRIAYVMWRLAESFYNQLPSSFDRDLSSGYESVKYYRDLSRRFPKSEYVPQAVARVKSIEALIKQKQKYIADFYFKTKVYDAAVYRYKLILDTFDDTEIRNHAIERVLKSYAKLKQKKECSGFYQEYFSLVKKSEKAVLKNIYRSCQAL